MATWAFRDLNIAAVLAVIVGLPFVSPAVLPVAGTRATQSGSGEREPTKKTSNSSKKTTATPRQPVRNTRLSDRESNSSPRQQRCEAQPPQRGTGREHAEDLNGVKLEMVEIPAGSFCMGSPESEIGHDKNESPRHQVAVQSFYMGKYEVTHAQWRAVMRTNLSNINFSPQQASRKFKGDNQPVEHLSWNDAVEFCRKLSQLTGREYRLPSEAEWEYAARAGTTTPFAFGPSLSSSQANFDGNDPYGGAPLGVYLEKTTPVGSFSPNNFGLYDMHGNVWEWCQDWYHANYDGAPTDGSAWESGGEQRGRVLRGGSWYSPASVLRSAQRSSNIPGERNNRYGLRLVLKSI